MRRLRHDTPAHPLSLDAKRTAGVGCRVIPPVSFSPLFPNPSFVPPSLLTDNHHLCLFPKVATVKCQIGRLLLHARGMKDSEDLCLILGNLAWYRRFASVLAGAGRTLRSGCFGPAYLNLLAGRFSSSSLDPWLSSYSRLLHCSPLF